jgi:hypothetical protein
MWHCNEKNVKPGISPVETQKWRKGLKIVKELLHKASRGDESAYMTGTMRNHANHVTANRRAALLQATG